MPDPTPPPPSPLDSLPLFDDTPRVDPEPLPRSPGPAASALAGPAPEARGLRVAADPPRTVVDLNAMRLDVDGPSDVDDPRATPLLDWALVRAFRQQAADQLAGALREREGLDESGRHELGRRIVLDLLTAHADEALSAGSDTFTADEQQALAAAVFDALFSLGRLQGLVDQPDLENIEIYGHDQVVLEHSDGRLTDGPPIADSDEELIESLQFLASRTGGNDRPFSPLHPHLHLRLDGGARLAASAWVTPRPLVVIRRHRLIDVTMDQLVDLGMFSPDLASFLSAAVRAQHSVVLSGAQGAGKALALDTPIPTPGGWTTMGALRAGDQVFDEHGQPCTVRMVHDVQHDRPCYEVVFDDGEVITADGDHLWQVTRRADRDTRNGNSPAYFVDHRERQRLQDLADAAGVEPDRHVTISQLVDEVGADHRNVLRAITKHLGPTGHVRMLDRTNRSRDMHTYSRQQMLKELAVRRSTPINAANRMRAEGPVILSTAEMGRNIWAGAGKPWRTYNHQITLTGAVQYPTKDLPVDPYVLGVWLGDGASSCARISTADPEVLEQFEAAGYPCKPAGGYDYYVGGDLQPKLRALGVLGDKHVPRGYLQSDVAQRTALLQGLMDSDGHCAKRTSQGTRTSRGGAVEFAVTSELLATQAQELALSLGFKAHLRSKPAMYRGRACGTVYTVSWTTNTPVFRLPRKLDRQRSCTTGPGARAVVEVRPVSSVPVRCITVDAPSALFLAGRHFVPTHNTTLLRALCSELDVDEKIGTFETEYELHLHEMPGRHRRVAAFEARPGSGERGPDGRQAGEISLDEHLYSAWRHNISRLIVGELRGKEITALFKAMQGSAGSMSTLHAHSARAAIGRMVTLAMDGSNATESYASRQVGENIQLIVQVKLETSQHNGVRRRSRYVSEVLAIEPAGDGQPTMTRVYVPGPDGRAVPGTLPQWLSGLSRQGFDDSAFTGRVA